MTRHGEESQKKELQQCMSKSGQQEEEEEEVKGLQRKKVHHSSVSRLYVQAYEKLFRNRIRNFGNLGVHKGNKTMVVGVNFLPNESRGIQFGERSYYFYFAELQNCTQELI